MDRKKIYTQLAEEYGIKSQPKNQTSGPDSKGTKNGKYAELAEWRDQQRGSTRESFNSEGTGENIRARGIYAGLRELHDLLPRRNSSNVRTRTRDIN